MNIFLFPDLFERNSQLCKSAVLRAKQHVDIETPTTVS